MDQKQVKTYLKGIVMLAVLAGIGVLFQAFDLGNALDESWIDSHIRNHGLYGITLFVGAGALFTAVGLPRQIISFLSGYAYGFVAGTALGTLATTIGCALAFFYSRFFGRSFVNRRFGKRIQKVDSFLTNNTISTALVIRFMPVGSNILTNLLAGVTGVKSGPFLLGSAIGFIPQTLIFALLGSGFNVDPVWRTSLSIALFIISTWLGFKLYRARKNSLPLEDSED
ncbi:VTT domain-containing protein [Desulfobaculum bizertense]|uniref:TVP38/TMEM64 family protein n=1 Tax=Desulfobaculum bizertense TaxID=376490 RepID=UPI001F314F83|nr:VTT domain-containing protein [Desulfobaculum bizertense]UIJ37693.1 VTT domain-containing protein [Desulfobaculum bizertense]